MSTLHVTLTMCPCGRCVTSWSRGNCYWKRAVSTCECRAAAARWPGPRRKPETQAELDAAAEIDAIGALWKHRAEDDDGYSREDEIEWYRAAYGRDATETELATWGRSPIDWGQVPTDEIAAIVARDTGEANLNPSTLRAARNARKALEQRSKP